MIDYYVLRNYQKEIQRLKEMIINPIHKMNKNKELTYINKND